MPAGEPRSRLWPDLTPLRTVPGFRQLFASRTITAFGAQATEVAVLVQARQLTHSPLAVGLLGVAELVPLVVFGLYGGVLADRFDRRALMRWCEAALCGTAALLLANALLPHPAVWPLYALTAVMMALTALQRPSLDASMPRLLPKHQLTAGAALMSMSQNANFLLGSSLGGVLAVTPGPWLVYALDAAGFAASFVFLTRLPALPGATSEEVAGVRDGLRYAFTRRDLVGSYLSDLSAMIFAYPNAMFPFMAVDLHAPWSAGLMFAAPSAGALAVTVVSGWMGRVRRHGLAIALAGVVWGLAIAGFGLSPDVYLALTCLVAAGGADMISGIFRDTLWNQTIPDELRGRLAGVELLSYGVGPSVGQFRSGLVASLSSTRFSLVSGGLLCTGAIALVCAALPAFTRYKAQTLQFVILPVAVPQAVAAGHEDGARRRRVFRRAPGRPRGRATSTWDTYPDPAPAQRIGPRNLFVTSGRKPPFLITTSARPLGTFSVSARWVANRWLIPTRWRRRL